MSLEDCIWKVYNEHLVSFYCQCNAKFIRTNSVLFIPNQDKDLFFMCLDGLANTYQSRPAPSLLCQLEIRRFGRWISPSILTCLWISIILVSVGALLVLHRETMATRLFNYYFEDYFYFTALSVKLFYYLSRLWSGACRVLGCVLVRLKDYF